MKVILIASVIFAVLFIGGVVLAVRKNKNKIEPLIDEAKKGVKDIEDKGGARWVDSIGKA